MRVLDLFCGAGGAAMGLHRAGYEVVGVDIKPQPRYPFAFVQGDALNPPVRLEDFDLIWASPPCQGYSVMKNLPWVRDKKHPLLINPIRKLLKSSGVAWVIENVMGARLNAGWLCGGMFELPFYRHRAFETSFFWLQPAHPPHREVITKGRMLGDRARRGHEKLDLPWMSAAERNEAIPPAYSEFIGRAALTHPSNPLG